MYVSDMYTILHVTYGNVSGKPRYRGMLFGFVRLLGNKVENIIEASLIAGT